MRNTFDRWGPHAVIGYYSAAALLFLVAAIAFVGPAMLSSWDWMSNPLMLARAAVCQVAMSVAAVFFALGLDPRALGDPWFQAYLLLVFLGMLALNAFDIHFKRRAVVRLWEMGMPLPRGVSEADVIHWAEAHPARGVA